ncbi:MAG TPA: hypothetical protein DGG94_10045 [Micromonosporaceae bacterium]|nr:hypothetical protein [Micromonosporaceae bacterium]HCU50124.1 hypothetical protein [Micromonosporaceae bacterium]
MTSDPGGLVAATIAALDSMPAMDRALSAAALIAAVQGVEDRRIARIRWAAIAELHDSGITMTDIGTALGVTAEAVDLALQAHKRASSVPV